MATYSYTLTEKEINKIKTVFAQNERLSKNPYIEFEAALDDCIISVYTSKKVVFAGKAALDYASAFDSSLVNSFVDQAGSDEVGTGDVFGPVCVCAVCLTSQSYEKLKHLPIQDSKQLTDEMICKIAPEIISTVPYSLLILENEKYNQVHDANNLNKMKAILHNQAYLNLQKKCKLPALCVVDQFAPESVYYNYLKGQPDVYSQLHFETKSENKYPSVACASIIARYAFLKTWEKMEEKYQMTFTKGAGSLVDQDLQIFVDQYGRDELKKVCKLHFKNLEKIK